MLLTALSSGDAILLIVLISIPLAALSFLGAGAVYKGIGKGAFAMDHDLPQKEGPRNVSAAQRKAEIRQMLEAKAFRQASRGQTPLDVDAELARALAAEGSGAGGHVRGDPQLVAEVRQLVEASNARRIRMGKDPLDVEAEVERQLTELESLGQ